jgi:succinate-acetate transporter protein
MAIADTATPVSPTMGTSPTMTSAEHVETLADKGSGIYYAASSDGISLQLGALSILLALLWAFQANIVSGAGLPFMLPTALAVGGVGIFAGGMWNMRKGVTIAGVIGGLYGVFWLSFGLLLLIEAGPLTKSVGAVEFGHLLGLYLWIWMFISAGLAVATWFVNRTVFAQQAVLALVFLALGIGYSSAPGGSGMLHIGGWLSLVDGILAWYVSMALVINETAGKTIVPLP